MTKVVIDMSMSWTVSSPGPATARIQTQRL